MLFTIARLLNKTVGVILETIYIFNAKDVCIQREYYRLKYISIEYFRFICSSIYKFIHLKNVNNVKEVLWRNIFLHIILSTFFNII